jgi:4'-phosphopantetheinyl transferase
MQPGRSFDLSKRQIHVWTLRTNAPRNVISRFEEVLAPDEIGRAAQFRVSRPRESFILTRAALRYLLGHYLGQSPASICLQYGTKGKPALSQNGELRFNVTHSGEMAAIALTRGCDVGIDLEQLRSLPDLEEIAARSFSDEEAVGINSLPASARARAFFECWTRKEAYVKAIGVGLSKPLNSFRVTTKRDSPANLMFLGDEIDASESWTLHDLFLGPDYAGAVAYSDLERPLSIFPTIDSEQIFNILE